MLLSHATRTGSRPPIARLVAATLLFAVMLVGTSSCGIHSGGGEIAFMRDGALWSIQADGSNSVYIAGNKVVGFAWSPNHHELVYRSGASALLAAQGRSPVSTLGAPEAPSVISVASINGGAAIQISPDVDAMLRGDAWWDPSGHRLLYAEYAGVAGSQPSYIQSQADQPAGIARKLVANAVTLPVISPDGKQIAVIDAQGNLLLGTAQSQDRVVATGALVTLPQFARPARVLWQPRHNALLYATTSPGGVSLRLSDLTSGHTILLGTTALALDYAFSPDGARLLVKTPYMLEVWNVTQPGPPMYMWSESDEIALAWWSPDGSAVLVQDHTGWWLGDIKSGNFDRILYESPTSDAPPTNVASWHPAAGSPWSADGARMVFSSGAGMWRGQSLTPPHTGAFGLYVAEPRNTASQPRLLDSGPDSAASWSYADPSTTFLVGG
ncbi:MAG TPA: hypothetical protein VJN88_16210 [Ktedonobacterales bacterium]|nr:hypothetical protein [Ktedonobacterales bacterium]